MYCTRFYIVLPLLKGAAMRYLFVVTFVISLFLMSCATTETVVSVGDLQTQFEVIALSEIVRARVEISDQSWQLLKDMIRSGLDRLDMDGATGEQYTQAETSLRRFVLEEIVYAIRQNPLHPRIGEGTFDFLKSLICPLYPFC